ncbi:MAG TPA: pyridoxamine 5'-phosphate oxidase family protein [Candidatus Dormibacteraeota bacterium]|nr:pyridoxamine 5'-phosphate oxidase family protein [Candidatus Dormibacteraeota bacterium]
MDKHVESRLKKEAVVWLVTAGKECRPQAVPVWFIWDGNSFLIYAQDGIKVNHVRANPHVELHLNEIDDNIVRASGYATIARGVPPNKNPAYMRKYRTGIKNIGMTPESYAAKYHNVIAVRRVKFH